MIGQKDSQTDGRQSGKQKQPHSDLTFAQHKSKSEEKAKEEKALFKKEKIQVELFSTRIKQQVIRTKVVMWLFILKSWATS